MSSSNAQSIDLPTDCTAWRFWTMRQPNGCSIPAPKSSAVKQRIKELAQKKEEKVNQATQLRIWNLYFVLQFVSSMVLSVLAIFAAASMLGIEITATLYAGWEECFASTSCPGVCNCFASYQARAFCMVRSTVESPITHKQYRVLYYMICLLLSVLFSIIHDTILGSNSCVGLSILFYYIFTVLYTLRYEIAMNVFQPPCGFRNTQSKLVEMRLQFWG